MYNKTQFGKSYQIPAADPPLELAHPFHQMRTMWLLTAVNNVTTNLILSVDLPSQGLDRLEG